VGVVRVGPTAGRWIGAGLLVMAGLFVLLGLAEHPPTVLLLIAMIGFVDGTTDVLFDTVIQREADPSRYGAVFGLASAFFTTTMMGAVAAAPLLNELLAPDSVIIGASVFLLLAGLIALAGMRAPQLESTSPEPVVEQTRVRRVGDDISVVTWGTLVPLAEEVAAELARAGISVEIVDLGNTVDWDPGTVIASVRRTSKVLIAGNGGVDAEVAATLAEQAFEHLDGPIKRLPAPALEDLAAGVRELDAY
jgi:MFS family permease